MTIEESRNFKRVSERLTTSGVVGADRLARLAAEGYEVVINMLPDSSEQAVLGEREILQAQGVRYVHVPVDFKQPTLADYDRFVAALDEAGQRKTHIHCAANYRVSVFYALYAQARGEWSAAEAERFVQSLWQPQAAEGWPAFIARVRRRAQSE